MVNSKKIDFYAQKNGHKLPTKIIKRDGRVTTFDLNRIESAIQRCYDSCENTPLISSAEVTEATAKVLSAKTPRDEPTHVEKVQDYVEGVLLSMGEWEAAKTYILYRAERANDRARDVPEDVQLAFEDAAQYFPTQAQQFMFFDKYSRYSYELGRRETWVETVTRSVDFLRELSQNKLEDQVYERIYDFILNMKAMPSMRLLATAGDYARSQNLAIFNCSYLPVSDLESFCEAMLISMSGCVSAETWIQTSSGPEQVKNLLNRPFIAVVDGQEFKSITGFFENGKKQLYRLTTAYGYNVELTYEHPVLTKSGWKQAGTVAVGEEIKISRHIPRETKFWKEFAPSYPSWSGYGTFNQGYLAGTFIGDGEFAREREARLVVHDKDNGKDGILQRTLEAVKEVPEYRNLPRVWRRHVGREQVELSLGTWLADSLDFTRTALKPKSSEDSSKAIPSTVETTSSEFYRGFLRGMLDTDGGVLVSRKQKEIKIFQSNKGNLLLLQRMLSRLGIISKVQKRSDATEQIFPGGRVCHVKARYQLVISRDSFYLFTVLIGASHTEKAKRIYDGIANAEYWTRSIEWDKVASFEPTSIELVYDATVEGAHAYDANGILLHNCGVGFSVEAYNVDHLPHIKRQKKAQEIQTHFIEDSTEGWVEALRIGLNTWVSGEDVEFDYSGVRRAGLPLRRKGGRASGPGPLKEMLSFVRNKIISRQGQYLRPIDAHDIMCAVGQAAVSGGVRRTAMISLFDWDDHEMRTCKDGNKLEQNPIRWNANNSAVWPEHLTQQEFIQQMLDMDKGRRGEPGIFSRENAIKTKPARRKRGRFGGNPCNEVVMHPFQLCNLSIAVARFDDTLETIKEKVEVASIIGTIQSMAEHFPGLREDWVQTQREERLLGVDILGIQDSPITRNAEVLQTLRSLVVETNATYAALLGINPSAATTVNKPGGNSSQLLNTASGIHARHAKFYRRNMRVSATSPIYRALKEAGVPMSPENGQTIEDAVTWVIPFPIKSPSGAVLRDEMSAIQQLEVWLLCKENWTEHNPSCTVSYSEEELLDVINWVWQHRTKVGGISFLPRENADYAQMPYEEITEEEYLETVAAFPGIDFSKIYRYELEDMTTATRELSCFAGSCDL